MLVPPNNFFHDVYCRIYGDTAMINESGHIAVNPTTNIFAV